ncbi:30S ribosomal protein S18 [Rhodococcus sp. 3Y1]
MDVRAATCGSSGSPGFACEKWRTVGNCLAYTSRAGKEVGWQSSVHRRRSHAPWGRKPKKNPLFAAKITHVDYKDINLLRTFISDRGKIRSRRVTGLTRSSSVRSPLQ